MAIDLATVYTNAIPPSASYPGGSFKNASSGSAQDGTPLDQAWANDFLGFFQALLANAGITPSGSPDTATASQYLQALQAIATPLGSTFFSPLWTSPPSGFLEMDGSTIGSATSGSSITHKSNAYLNLYTLAWSIPTSKSLSYDQVDNLVVSGVNGAFQAKASTALIDWANGNGVILPDMRGVVPRGWDHGRGLDWATGGRGICTYQADSLLSHFHSFNKSTSAQEGTDNGGASTTDSGTARTPTGYTGAVGGGENTVKNLAGMWVIKY